MPIDLTEDQTPIDLTEDQDNTDLIQPQAKKANKSKQRSQQITQNAITALNNHMKEYNPYEERKPDGSFKGPHEYIFHPLNISEMHTFIDPFTGYLHPGYLWVGEVYYQDFVWK